MECSVGTNGWRVTRTECPGVSPHPSHSTHPERSVSPGAKKGSAGTGPPMSLVFKTCNGNNHPEWLAGWDFERFIQMSKLYWKLYKWAYYGGFNKTIGRCVCVWFFGTLGWWGEKLRIDLAQVGIQLGRSAVLILCNQNSLPKMRKYSHSSWCQKSYFLLEKSQL